MEGAPRTNEWGDDADRRAVIDAVESWLVDPRREPRARRVTTGVPAEIQLDRDFASFLSQHGLT